jgi:hypothetical protein
MVWYQLLNAGEKSAKGLTSHNVIGRNLGEVSILDPEVLGKLQANILDLFERIESILRYVRQRAMPNVMAEGGQPEKSKLLMTYRSTSTAVMVVERIDQPLDLMYHP